ncbi:MAG: hypothetical protein E7262_04195 [Lachnospiraceae bacterium]|nr:hypothetical protein [Lachnospiraceae bacterium]
MSSLILCKSVKASKPYLFTLTDTNIYTIEELCYYIYNNIYIITEKIFDESLILWLKDEFNMHELSEKLSNMTLHGSSLKDIVVTIFCSADYYNEKNIKDIIEVIDMLEGMPLLLRRKIKADNYLTYKNYSLASKEYEEILDSPDINKLDSVHYGNIVHNLGIVRMNISSFYAAAECFKEAYVRNNNKESLSHYLCALKLEHRDDEYQEAIRMFSPSKDDIMNIEERFIKLRKEAMATKKFMAIDRLMTIKGEGRVNEYYEVIDKMIVNWKTEYKNKRAVRR